MIDFPHSVSRWVYERNCLGLAHHPCHKCASIVKMLGGGASPCLTTERLVCANTVSYVRRSRQHRWRCDDVTFHCGNHGLCSQWTRLLNEQLAQLGESYLRVTRCIYMKKKIGHVNSVWTSCGPLVKCGKHMANFSLANEKWVVISVMSHWASTLASKSWDST